MAGFTKLFNSILYSTIWQEPKETKLLWITMLAMADAKGEVQASIPGLAKVAGITIPECETALTTLLSPDPYSRTPEHEGRRIETVVGGWRLLNHGKYRALLSAEERKEYNRKKQAEYRAAQAAKAAERVNDMSMTVNDSEQCQHITEAEAEVNSPFAQSGLTPVSAQPKISWCFEGGFNGITQEDRQSWKDAFPAVCLDTQLARAHAWLRSNPAKAKKSQWRRFITGWLARAQEKGGDIPSNQPQRKPSPQSAADFGI